MLLYNVFFFIELRWRFLVFWRSYVCVFAHVCLFKCYARLTSRHACMLNDVNLFSFQKKKERNSLLLSQYVTVFFFSDYIGAVCTLFLARRETYRRKTNCVSLFPIVVCFWLLCELLADVSLSVSSLCYTSFFRLLLFERRFITSREREVVGDFFFPPILSSAAYARLLSHLPFPFFYLLYMKEFMPRLLIYL